MLDVTAAGVGHSLHWSHRLGPRAYQPPNQDPTREQTMSRRPRGKLTKELHDPAAPDVRRPKQPRVPKFKAGKKRGPSARPPKH